MLTTYEALINAQSIDFSEKIIKYAEIFQVVCLIKNITYSLK
jgi:hypothetical protein